MSWLTRVAYILFFLSVVIPVYTYAIYPLILLFFHKRHYESDDAFLPSVSVLIVGGEDAHLTEDKLESLRSLEYPHYDLLTCEKTNSEGLTVIDNTHTQKMSALNCLIKSAGGEIIVFTDNKTPIDSSAIKALIRHFADKRVGCVVGQLRSDNPSAFWKYENYVRWQEGKAGRLSGANKAIYAVRKNLIEVIPDNIINVDFYVSTFIQQLGYDILFEPEATAYECPNEKADHVRDGTGYLQALRVFWRMLLPRKGSFVYWSHRVLKWMVPLNLLTLLFISLLLSSQHILFMTFFILQIIGYFVVSLHEKAGVKCGGMIDRTLDLVTYFLRLNLDWLKGYVKRIE